MVTVPALPLTLPVMVLLKVLLPEKVLLLARSVDDAAFTVREPPAVKGLPLIVPRVPVRRLVPMDEVATSLPVLSVPNSALVRPVNHVVPVVVSWVVDALANWVNAVCVDDALSMYPLVKVWRFDHVLVVVVLSALESVTAPVLAEARSGYVAAILVTPVFVTLPPAYARPPEKVVVAVHVGTPLRNAST